jgi:hypothetical protein
MQKSIILRNFRICLLFWPLSALITPVSAQDRGSFFPNRFDQSEDDDSSDRPRRDWRSFRGGDSFGEGFSPRDRFRGMDSRRGEFRDGDDFEGRSFGRFGPPGGDFGGFRSRDRGDMSGPSENDSASPRPDMKPRVRITVDLPASFTAGDLDGDGQIGLYEWKQWRRGDLAGFQSYDHNNDGFLTPAELTRGPQSPVAMSSGSGAAAAGNDPHSTTLTSGPTPPGGLPAGAAGSSGTEAAASTTAAPGATGDTTAVSNQAQSLFRLMDRNRDGMLNAEEWAKATKLKARFEAAKIDVSAPMSRDAFIEHFVHLPPSSS